MDDKKKTKEQLIRELESAKKRIKELKQIQDTLRESENNFKQIADNLRDSIWLRTRDEYLYISPAFEKIWRRSRKIVYENSNSGFDFMHPEDKKHLLAKYNTNKFQTDEIFNEEYRIIRPDGEIRWISTRSFPIKSKERKTVKRVGICEDITKRKKNEEKIKKLSSAMEQSIDGIAICGNEKELLYVNKAFAKMHGYSPKEMLGMQIIELHSKRQMADVKNNMSDLMEKGIWEGEIGHMKKDGTEFPTFMTVSLLKGKNGKPAGILGIMRDISRVKQTHKELEQKNIALKEILAQIEREKTEIRDNISENIDNLIIPYLNELDSGTNKTQKQLIKLILKNLHNISTESLQKKLPTDYIKLSSREIEICNMIKNELSNKEIADALCRSILTIEKHRQRIRKKLGISNKRINLAAYIKQL